MLPLRSTMKRTFAGARLAVTVVAAHVASGSKDESTPALPLLLRPLDPALASGSPGTDTPSDPDAPQPVDAVTRAVPPATIAASRTRTYLNECSIDGGPLARLKSTT